MTAFVLVSIAHSTATPIRIGKRLPSERYTARVANVRLGGTDFSAYFISLLESKSIPPFFVMSWPFFFSLVRSIEK